LIFGTCWVSENSRNEPRLAGDEEIVGAGKQAVNNLNYGFVDYGPTIHRFYILLN
jgi:hypothetical protein